MAVAWSVGGRWQGPLVLGKGAALLTLGQESLEKKVPKSVQER